MKASPLLVLACSMVVVTGISATTVIPPTFRQMVERADRIFVGETVDAVSYWTRTTIHTDVTFRVTATLKGADAALVRLTFRGGRVGDVVLEVDGVPQFVPGDEQVLFVVDRPGHVSPIVGFWHGRVRVTRHPATGIAHVLRHDQTPFARAAAVTEPADPASAEFVMPMPLSVFLDNVRQILRDGAR